MNDLTKIQHELIEDLAKMLTKASGFEFVANNQEVEPASYIKKKAELKEYGSSVLGVKPEPYYNKTIAKWKSKHGIS